MQKKRTGVSVIISPNMKMSSSLEATYTFESNIGEINFFIIDKKKTYRREVKKGTEKNEMNRLEGKKGTEKNEICRV